MVSPWPIEWSMLLYQNRPQRPASSRLRYCAKLAQVPRQLVEVVQLVDRIGERHALDVHALDVGAESMVCVRTRSSMTASVSAAPGAASARRPRGR